MDSDKAWKLFYETGAPIFYIINKNMLRKEEGALNVQGSTGLDNTGSGIQG